MLPVVANGAWDRRRSSSANLVGAKRLARAAGRPLTIVLALLVLIGGTSFLLLSRISDAEKPEQHLHVVSERARQQQHGRNGGGGSGGGSGGTQRSHLLEQQQHQQRQLGVKQDVAQLAKEVGQLAQDLQHRQQGQAGGGEQLAADNAARAAEVLAQRQAALRAGGRLGKRDPVDIVVNFPPRPDPPAVELSDEEVTRRREEIRDAMRHAWAGYVQHAWGNDELCPVSKKGKNSFGGLGATIVDSLDTLHMMGLREEYERAAEWVRTSMPLNASFDASVFETIIRVVGGMLAAHDLTGDEVMLHRAQQVADRLLPAYDTPTGIPYNIINLATQKAKNPTWNQRASTLAEFGTHQLEFWRLSQRTGNATYAELAEATIRHLHKGWPHQGLMPLFVSPRTGNFTVRRVSFGALGDSYYEYLLKMWLAKGRRDGMYRDMWEQAMDEMIARLVFTSKEGYTYVAEFDRFTVKHKMDHLVCFVPGMLALGAHSGAVQGAKAERYIALAANLTHTCWQMYNRQPTGLSPEYVTFTEQGMKAGAAYNLLRPEALEAFWYMWRVTRDWRYRAWGWQVFLAFQQHCKAEAGYSGIKDVRQLKPMHDDTQQSFFLAETLKYLFLLFSDDSALDMETWVLNTEAHPLRVTQPTQQQQQGQQQQQQQHKRWWWPPARSKQQAAGSAPTLQQQ